VDIEGKEPQRRESDQSIVPPVANGTESNNCSTSVRLAMLHLQGVSRSTDVGLMARPQPRLSVVVNLRKATYPQTTALTVNSNRCRLETCDRVCKAMGIHTSTLVGRRIAAVAASNNEMLGLMKTHQRDAR
jgi:hypothetical protein